MKRWGISFAGKELSKLSNLGKDNVKGLRQLILLSTELLQLADEKEILRLFNISAEQIEILKKYDIDESLQQTIFTMGLYAHLDLLKTKKGG